MRSPPGTSTIGFGGEGRIKAGLFNFSEIGLTTSSSGLPSESVSSPYASGGGSRVVAGAGFRRKSRIALRRFDRNHLEPRFLLQVDA